MGEWKEYKTTDLLDQGILVIGDGYRAKNVELSATKLDGLPFARVGNINGGFNFHEADYFPTNNLKRVGEKISKVGDVVFTSKGTVGRFAYVNEKSSMFVYSPQLCFWRSLNHGFIFPRFLFYWMQGREFFEQADAVKGQTDMADYVNLSDQRKMKITLPEINEQRALASVLSSLDDKINLLHHQNATLEAMAETLFRQWFVEPSKKILNEGAVIEGFENGKFEKWIIETVGGEWGKENIEGDYTRSVYCIRGTDIADLNTGIPLKTPIRFVKETKFRNIEPREGDLIIEISGGTETQSTGRVCYINKGINGLFNKPLVFSNFCRMIRVRRFEFTYFLYCYIQYLYNQDEFFNLENGSSGIKNLNYKALLFELEYPMPNEELVIKFHDRVESLFKKINQNKTKTITLTALRDTLLPKLMSGEVRVKINN